MKKITLNKNCTHINIGNSILKRFGVKPLNNTFKPLDKIFKESKKDKVCLILFDALGTSIITKYKDVIPYIYSHIVCNFESTYPPTTVCTTTALTTGLYPIQTGYFGWNQYFEKYDDYINVFLSNSKVNGKLYPNIQKTILKVDYIWELINKQNKKEIASSIYSFNCIDLDTFFNETDKLIKNHNFLYSYCTEPDHTMHTSGTSSKNTIKILKYLENKLIKLIESNKDTLFVLIADHSMVDTIHIDFSNDKKFLNTLASPYLQIEGRFSGFNVKDKENFIKYYEDNLKDSFLLKTKQELLNEHTFGYGKPSKLTLSFLPEYFLLAKKEYMLNDGLTPKSMIANHAGITNEEREVSMMIFNK